MMRTSALLLMLALLASACAPSTPRGEPSPGSDVAGEQPAQTQTEPADEGASQEAGFEPSPMDGASDEETSAEPSGPAPTEASSEPETGKDGKAAENQPGTIAQPAPEPSSEPAREEKADTPPPAASNIDIEGRVSLSGGEADPTETVIYFVPDHGDAANEAGAPDSDRPREIITRDKSLSPTVMAVPRGTEIRFPNEDPILHNLFSVSPGNDFDLGVYGPGESPSVSFDEAGVVNIYCNVHHDMHAHVLVVDTPWRTRADASGRFSLGGLPAGDGELHVWHRQAERWSRSITLPGTGPFDIELEVTRPQLPAHRDKAGQPYNRRDRDPYR